MSDSNGDRVQVVGAGDDRPAWRPPGGLLLILAGLVVGLAAGVLLTRPGTSNDAVNEPPPPTTTAPPDPEGWTATRASETCLEGIGRRAATSWDQSGSFG